MRRNLFPEHNRIKPKPSAKNVTTRIITNPEYLEWFTDHHFSCIVCGTTEGIEGHHVKRDSTDRKRDDEMLPLCREHHHGRTLSPHGTPTLFREEFPMHVQKRLAYDYFKEWKETSREVSA